MATYHAPLRDMQFVLHELLDAETRLQGLPGHEEVNRELMDSILEEGAKFAEAVLFPLNRSGDEEGCHLNDGSVTTPKGYKEAYQQFCDGGWTGLDCDTQYGGQGLPHTLAMPFQEMQVSANMAWAMYPGLTHGAYAALHAHGSSEQKATYLPKLVEGRWTGTMCLTEPHCGTDLGLLKTRAEAAEDGSYRITGTKIFISSGEHDMSENIVHLVLARLPDSPKDIKGISLFIVPKFLPDANGDVGERNSVSCGSLEHKMGIKSNATCVMNFDGAKGYLIGDVNRGMNYMFTMMNAARLGVGMQGLGLNEVSYQIALAYAKDRLQMRALNAPAAPEKPADPIIVHPDVRRMLLTMKTYAEAGRAFAYWLALLLDEEERGDENQRQDAADLLALLIPVAKAFMTDNGFESTNHGMQVLGGHGFIREWGMEQFARDARIAQIYEGTNGIQALDLLGRKIMLDQGVKLRKFTKLVHKFCEAHDDTDGMDEFTLALATLNRQVGDITMKIGMAAMQNKDEVGAAATDYLRLLGHLVYGWFWARMVAVSLPKADEPFYAAKIASARFYYAKLMPETQSLLAKLGKGAKSVMALDADHFHF